VREVSQRTVWAIYDGVRYGIPSPRVLEDGWPGREPHVLPDGSRDLLDLPTVPPNGTVLRGASSGRAFVIHRGWRLHLRGELADSMTEYPGVVLPDDVITAHDHYPYAGSCRRPPNGPLAEATFQLNRFRYRYGVALDRLLWAVIGAVIGFGVTVVLGALFDAWG
jgi:hypothetical protein